MLRPSIVPARFEHASKLAMQCTRSSVDAHSTGNNDAIADYRITVTSDAHTLIPHGI